MNNDRCSLIKVTFKDTFAVEALKTTDNNGYVNESVSALECDCFHQTALQNNGSLLNGLMTIGIKDLKGITKGTPESDIHTSVSHF